MPPLDPHDLREIMAVLSRIADANWPGHRGGKLVVKTGYGKAALPIPPWRPPTDAERRAEREAGRGR